MRRISIARRERRVLVVGGALIVGMIASSRGVPAWRDWQRDTLAAAAELAAEVARAEASVRGLQATVDSLEVRQRRFVALAPMLVGVESPSAATGALTLLVSGAAQAAGVKVLAIRVGRDSAEGAVVRRVSLRADLEGDARGVASLLAVLERGPVLLAVRDVSITQPDPAAPADRPETLSVQLLVEGLAIDRGAAGEARP